jgi:hypothetical protein
VLISFAYIAKFVVVERLHLRRSDVKEELTQTQ